ncbi:MAG: TIGR04282 family arsenosugar biosynthesis glycosyltransferase [Anaerolineae bacterium]
MGKRALVLMAKQPAAGRTKTRLSPPLSPEAAAGLYRCFLLDKLAQMRGVESANLGVAYWPATAREYFAALAPGFTLIPQAGADLAERLRNVFDLAFHRGYEQVMAIDGDTPTLPAGHLRQGFQRLDDPAVDVVLGPCEDGGYYAIGMKRPHPTLFDVAMSTPRVVEDTLARAEAAGLRVALLPNWYDVDTPADLERLAAELAGTDGVKALATARFLEHER